MISDIECDMYLWLVVMYALEDVPELTDKPVSPLNEVALVSYRLASGIY